eukprot:scaffold82069_cov54-Phaeocystis_antarctica.AAC.1
MVRTKLLWRVLCWATLRRPFVAAAWFATCRVCLAAMHAALPAWVAVVAMAPLARMRSLRLPSAATSSTSSEFRVYSSLTRQTDQESPISRSWLTSSTSKAQLASGGRFPWAGRRAETTR